MSAVSKKQKLQKFNIGLVDPSAALIRTRQALDASFPAESPLISRLQTLQRRLAEERLQLAVLGQFKRGKSTFLNALLGVPLLPMGVVPMTAIPTFIAWGPDPLVQVSYRTGKPPDEFHAAEPEAIRQILFRFVTEEANPENRLGVARVSLFFPAHILRDGVVLIDTPGIGSTHSHNTDEALRVLPECDAALFIVSVDPPITEIEIDYLRKLRSQVSRVFFILNKIDYLGLKERDEATAYLRKVLKDHAPLDAGALIFSVSARQGLSAKETADGTALEQSGVAAVENHLLQSLAREKIGLLRSAVTRKATDILSDAATEVALRLRALDMPLQDLKQRTAAFEKALGEIEERRLVTRDLVAGGRKRILDELEIRAEELRTESRRRFLEVLDRALGDTASEEFDRVASNALPPVINEFFERALAKFTDISTKQIAEFLAGHHKRAIALIDSVRQVSAVLFTIPFAPAKDTEPFRIEQEPYWVTENWSESLIPDVSGLIDHLVPTAMRRTRFRARMERKIDDLILQNVENLRWAIIRGLDDTFWRATAQLEERLDDAISVTKGAIDAAIAARRNRSSQVASELDRLHRAAAQIDEARMTLNQILRPVDTP